MRNQPSSNFLRVVGLVVGGAIHGVSRTSSLTCRLAVPRPRCPRSRRSAPMTSGSGGGRPARARRPVLAVRRGCERARLRSFPTPARSATPWRSSKGTHQRLGTAAPPSRDVFAATTGRPIHRGVAQAGSSHHVSARPRVIVQRSASIASPGARAPRSARAGQRRADLAAP